MIDPILIALKELLFRRLLILLVISGNGVKYLVVKVIFDLLFAQLIEPVYKYMKKVGVYIQNRTIAREKAKEMMEATTDEEFKSRFDNLP
jgi:hypothetical protein